MWSRVKIIKVMNINKGLLQGRLVSLMLFDLCFYLDDINYATLAYADDIAVVCKNKESLINAISKVER